jgi:hypothetical protein
MQLATGQRNNLGVLSSDDKKIKQVKYSFEFMPITQWGKKWTRSKKDFDSLEEATRAAGLWMQISFDNNWPVAVKLVEM